MLLHVLPELRVVIYPLMIWGFWSIVRRQNVFSSGFMLFYVGVDFVMAVAPGALSDAAAPNSDFFRYSKECKLLLSHPATRQESLVCRDSSICNPHPYRHRCGFYSGMALELYPTRSRVIISPCGTAFVHRTDGSGFGETFSWIKQNTRSDDVLATAYDPMYYLYTGRKAVRPWIHHPETYFYPYRAATPDLGAVEEIRDSLNKLGVRFIVVNPLEGYSERVAAAELFANLLRSYDVKPELVFESSDGLHRIYALPPPPAKSPSDPSTPAVF